MKSIELKVKLKHLAEESRIIRREAERQYKSGNYQKGNDLTNHRKGVVRPAARNTLIAYQTIRGIPYESYEGNAKSEPNWKEVDRMVKKYAAEEVAA